MLVNPATEGISMAVLEETVVDRDEQRVEELVDQLLEECPPDTTSEVEFLGRQYDLGLAWVHFPEGSGGLGLSPKLNRNVMTGVAKAGGPMGGLKNPIGYGMCGPAVVVHGTDEQKQLLRPLFTNEDIWCQLFSEPGAGSDVASLSTRAERDGDEWTLNGQKVWTTLAHISNYGLIIARSDPEQPKHRGITAFIVDMHAPGVEVKPLRQMTGEAEFNEVFFTDVRVPDSMRLDEVGRGWAVSITTLMNERVSIGGGTPPRNSGPIGQLLDVWNESNDHDPAMRDEFVRLWIRAEVNRLTNMRAAANRKVGTPGPEGSVSKIAMAELNKSIYSFALDVMGADGMLFDSFDHHPPKMSLFGDDMRKNFLRARANSIEGGTTEIMKNILGERVLGLPGDIRVDKEPPWSQVPRS
jgi:alkylation response protein AidB-like acyl-CoA dehydrogenase